MEVLQDAGGPWMHAFTYSAHPVGCAVALRTLQIVETERFPEQAAAKGDYLLDALRAALAGHRHVGDIRGKGLMSAVELVEDRATKQPFPAAAKVGPRVLRAALERGLLSRVKGDSFVLAPPIVITHEQLDRSVAILAEAVEAVLG